jgi:hypothetical protein
MHPYRRLRMAMASAPGTSACAACRVLRRKCTAQCLFAPYFPPDQPQKFAHVHKVRSLHLGSHQHFPSTILVPNLSSPSPASTQSCTLHECTNKRWACFLKNSYLSSFHIISSHVHSSMRRIESIIRQSRIQLQIQSKFEQIP